MYDVMGKIFKDFVVHIDYMEFFIVLKTLPGTANAIAASLDEANLPEVMGTIAGDDNVLIIIKPKDKVEELVQKFRKMMG